MKRLLKFLCCLFLVLSTVSVMTATQIKAGNVTTGRMSGVYYYVDRGHGNVTWGQEEFLYADNQIAYCIDPFSIVENGGNYAQSAWATYSGLSLAQKEAINLYAYFGYGYGGDTSKWRYVASQHLIWTTVTSASISWTSANQGGGSSLWSNIAPYYNDILAKVADYHNKPSWQVVNADGSLTTATDSLTIEGKNVGDIVEIKDVRGILNRFFISDLGGNTLVDASGNTVNLADYDTTVSGIYDNTYTDNADNTLYLKIGNVGNGTITLKTRDKWWNVGHTPLVFTLSGAQSVFRYGTPDPFYAPINFKDSLGAKVKVIKTDTNGATVANCVLQIVDKDTETVIHEWTTETGKEYEFDDLTPHHTYIIREYSASEGYYYAPDWEFTTGEANTTTYKTVINTEDVYYFAKLDGATQQPLADAVLQILDEGTAIYTMKSDGTEQNKATPGATYDADNLEVIKLKAGKTYTLHEVSAPDGYILADDQDFSIPKYRPNTASDTDTEEVRIDLNNNSVVTLVKMSDMPKVKLTITKTDKNDSTIKVSGATYTLYSDDTCTTLATVYDDLGAKLENGAVQTTDVNGELHYQVPSGVYFLKETKAPDGYFINDEVIRIEVPTTAEANEEIASETADAQMNIYLAKLNSITGDYVSGAGLQILNENGVVIYSTVSESEPINVGNAGAEYNWDEIERIRLEAGKTYTLHEVVAPFGYELNVEDVTFTTPVVIPVDDETTTDIDESVFIVSIKDDPKAFKLSVTKADAQDNTKKLAGCTIAIYDARTDTIATAYEEQSVMEDGVEVIKTVPVEAKGVTDANGVVSFNMTYENYYYAKEISAPLGYRLSSEKYEVIFAEDYIFGEDAEPITIEVNDMLLPATAIDFLGENTWVILVGGIVLIGGLVLGIVLKKKKK